MTTAQQRNVWGAVGILLVAAASLVIGLHALTYVDDCGGHPMSPADLCPNRDARTGYAWINDAGQQRARNHRVGVGMLAAGAGFAVTAGAVYRFTNGGLRRRGQRNQSETPGK